MDMAMEEPEYLEYKSRVNNTFSKSKKKIDTLKKQLTAMDLNYSLDENKSLFQESPVKNKTMRETYRRKEDIGTDEKIINEDFNLGFQDKNVNRVDLNSTEEKPVEGQVPEQMIVEG